MYKKDNSFVRIFNLLLVGLLAGSMLEEYFVVKIVFAGLSAQQWGEQHSLFGIFHIAVIIPIAVLATISLILILVQEWQLKTFAKKLTWIAAPFFVIIIFITAYYLMPINLSISEWNSKDIPDNWEEIKNEWILLHGIRTILCVLGFIFLTVSLYFARQPEVIEINEK